MTAVTVTVAVTHGHIARGKPGECASCPVALAVAAVLPGSNPDVYGCTVHLWHGGKRLSVLLPAEAVEFIGNFDGRRPVAPFLFTLDLTEAGP